MSSVFLGCDNLYSFLKVTRLAFIFSKFIDVSDWQEADLILQAKDYSRVRGRLKNFL